MAGPSEDVVGGAVFDLLAGVHHEDLIGQFRDHAEVVGDDDHGGAVLLLEFRDQVQDLGLYGHVEGGGRLVGYQQARVTTHRPSRS